MTKKVERIFLNDSCEDCPIAGSAECLIYCGSPYETLIDDLFYLAD